jgi:hypothetical protein
LVDERSVIQDSAGAFQLSIIGYARYLPRISALRQLKQATAFLSDVN